MMCPKCGSEKSRDARNNQKTAEEKYKQCQECGHRWHQNDWFGSMFEAEESKTKRERQHE